MQPLATEFEDRLFRYKQIERQGSIAIFAQTHKEGGVTRYEVVRIRGEPAHTWPNGATSPEREVYPNNKGWGAWGWIHHRLEDAQRHVQHLIHSMPARLPEEETPYA